MNQKFTKKELKRLGCTDEEILLVMRYQKKLPILIDNDNINGFCINARTLHEQLGSKRKFSEWVKVRINSYNFVENLDFSMVSPFMETKRSFGQGGDTRSMEYLLTLDMSKQLAMVEKTASGKETRYYFILMERLVKKNADWWTTRNPQRTNYKPMCEALSAYIHRQCGRYGDDYDFAREADYINIIATGSKAQSIKNYLGVGVNELTRDNLENEWNEKIAFLQEQNILLLGLDMKVIDRVKMLINMFEVKYPDATPIQQYLTREHMVMARKEIIDDLSR